jgi:hypothetical protein
MSSYRYCAGNDRPIGGYMPQIFNFYTTKINESFHVFNYKQNMFE